MISTIYFGGCWQQNIGNAFIDYGAMYMYEKYNCIPYSEWSRFYFPQDRQKNYFNNFVDLKPKCLFFSGMVTCDQFQIDQKEIIELADKYNIPIILNGVGGERYDKSEVDNFRSYIKNHNFYALISRDKESLENYGDLFKHSYRGVDVAFFLPDIKKFNILNNIDKKYTVINDDNGFARDCTIFQEYKNGLNQNNLAYTSHWISNIQEKDYVRQNSLLAEFPDEYIVLYAQSKITFSTRIHACIATLAFGGKTVFLYNSPRVRVLLNVGCENIENTPCAIDLEILTKMKNDHINNFEIIMKDLLK